MMYWIYTAFLLTILGACGSEPSQFQELVAADSSEHLDSADPGSVEAAIPACLYDCATDSRALISFTSAVPYDFGSCVIESFQIYRLKVGLVLIMKANCLNISQLYSVLLDSRGMPTTAPTLVSRSCFDAKKRVWSYAYSTSEQAQFFAYSCESMTVSSSKLEFYTSTFNFLNEAVETRLIDSVAIYRDNAMPYSIGVAYNQGAQQFAMTYDRKVIRFDGQGRSLGGALVTGFPEAQISAQDSSWLILADSRGGSCSKLSKLGILECFDKRIASVNRSFISASQSINTRQKSNGFYELGFFDLDSKYCSEFQEQSFGEFKLGNTQVVQLSGYRFSNGLAGLLIADSDSSTVSLVLSDDNQQRIIAHVAITRLEKIGQSFVTELGDRVFVFSLSQGRIYGSAASFLR